MKTEAGKRILVITGGVHEGKSTLLETLYRRMKDEGWEPGGFICRARLQKGGSREYVLTDLSNGKTEELTSRIPGPHTIAVGNYYLRLKAFEFGERLISEAMEKNRDPLVLDEAGLLEEAGRGWYRLMHIMANDKKHRKIWVMRRTVLEENLLRWGIPEENVFQPDATPEELFNKLKSL